MSSSSSSAPPTVAELQQQLAIAAQTNADLLSRGAAIHTALVSSQAALQASKDAAAARAPRPKIPTPRVFDGKTGAVIDTWADEVQKQFGHFGPYFATDEVKIEYALNFVNHEVTNWYGAHSTEVAAAGAEITTWVQFMDAMRVRYQPIESAHSARNSLDTAVQSGSVQAYSTHFQSLMTYIKDMSAADQVHQFIRGLKPLIRLEVMKQKPMSLTVAIEKAVGLEAYSRGMVQPSFGNSSTYRPHQSRSSYHAGASSSSAPMDVNNIEHDHESSLSQYGDVSPSRESHLLAVIQQQQETQAQMQQQLNALFGKNRDPRQRGAPSSMSMSSSSSSKVPGITPDVYRRCRDEGVCLRCKEKGHNASSCTKPVRLNW